MTICDSVLLVHPVICGIAGCLALDLHLSPFVIIRKWNIIAWSACKYREVRFEDRW